MQRLFRILFLALLVTAFTGCGSISGRKSRQHFFDDDPFFVGVKWDITAMVWSSAHANGLIIIPLFVIDLPLSFLADTVFLIPDWLSANYRRSAFSVQAQALLPPFNRHLEHKRGVLCVKRRGFISWPRNGSMVLPHLSVTVGTLTKIASLCVQDPKCNTAIRNIKAGQYELLADESSFYLDVEFDPLAVEGEYQGCVKVRPTRLHLMQCPRDQKSRPGGCYCEAFPLGASEEDSVKGERYKCL